MSLLKIGGIGCGVIAVLLLYHQQNVFARTDELRLGLVLVITAALCRAVYGVLSKAALAQGIDMDLLLLTAALCWVLSGLVYARFFEHRYAITRSKILYSILSGCLVYGIVRTLLSALALGEASIVITIANLSFLTALALALLLKMEGLSPRKLLAMGFAVGAIVLLTRA